MILTHLLMNVALSIEKVGQLAFLCLLITQAIVWVFEIWEVGFRSWLRGGMRQSYVAYLAAYCRAQWLRFARIFIIILLSMGICSYLIS